MSVNAKYYSLAYSENNETEYIGRRYVIYTGLGYSSTAKIALDFPGGSVEENKCLSDAESYLFAFLSNYDCCPSLVGRSIIGVVNNGCFTTNDWSEKLAVEVKDREHLKSLLNKVFVEYTTQLKMFKAIKDKFKMYTDSLLRSFRTNGIKLPTDVSYIEDNLEMSTRFMGGFENWSGGNGDICDADTLSFKTQKAIKECVEEFNNRVKDVMVEWVIGEKAYVYFYFKSKEGKNG